MERRTSLVGIYGGTFDPIHLGHVHLAKRLLEQYPFERFYFIPAKQNPLKSTGPCISDADRLALLQASVQELGDPRIHIDGRELQRPGLSYTVDTLNELRNVETGELVLIVGDEVFQQMTEWKKPQEIFSQTHVLVVKRTQKPLAPERLLHQIGLPLGRWEGNRYVHSGAENSQKWIEPVEINAMPYSSTELREQLNLGWKSGAKSEMPQGIQRSVWLLIKEKQLYAVSKKEC